MTAKIKKVIAASESEAAPKKKGSKVRPARSYMESIHARIGKSKFKI